MIEALDVRPDFYVAGGNLMPDAPSYIVRPADTELFDALIRGDFSYVLTSRQMGKSSLMHRTSIRLTSAGVRTVVLDLTSIGANLSADQWYYGLLTEIGEQIGCADQITALWAENRDFGSLQRFVRTLTALASQQITQPHVIFIDEIDFVRGLRFSADEFFAAIRYCYNGRANNPTLRQITFCLLGVATPADLIRDLRTTPFNIGRRIELTDFTLDEALPLAAGLHSNPEIGKRKLSRILYWTGGHPYLTQKLCLAICKYPDATVRDIDRICHSLFLASGMRVAEDNLIFVHNTLRNGLDDLPRVLGLYRRILSKRPVANDPSDPAIARLRLAGVVRTEGGRLWGRNRIYGQVFDKHWILENTPDAHALRERAAFRKGALRAALIFGAVAIAMGALAWQSFLSANLAHTQEELARNFLYVADMNLAEQAVFVDHKIDRAKELLDAHHNDVRRSFEYWLLMRAVNEAEYTFHDHNNFVYSLSASTPSHLLASAGLDKTVQISNYQTHEHLTSLNGGQGLYATSFSPDGKQLAATGSSGKVMIWETAHWAQVKTLDLHLINPFAIQYSSDSQTLAVGCVDGPIEIISLKSSYSVEKLPPASYGMRSLAFTPDGTRLIAGGKDGLIYDWDIRTRLLRQKIKAEASPITSISLAQQNTSALISYEDGSAILWDTKNWSRLYTFARSDQSIASTALSADGSVVAMGYMNGVMQIWNAATHELKMTLNDHTGQVTSLTFLGSSNLLASGAWDRTVKLWDLNHSGERHSQLNIGDGEIISCLPISHGERLMTMDNSYAFQCWNANTGASLARCTQYEKMYKDNSPSLAMLGTNQMAVIGSDHRCFLFKVGMGVKNAMSIEGELKPPFPKNRYIAVSPSSPSEYIVASDNTIRQWNPAQKTVQTLVTHSNIIAAMCISQNKKLVASSDYYSTKIYDLRRHELIRTIHTNSLTVTASIFSVDGQSLILADRVGKIRIWNIATGREVGALQGDYPATVALDFSPRGDMFYIIASNGMVKSIDVSVNDNE